MSHVESDKTTANVKIQGGIPLNGFISIPGARNSALKIIHAAMYSNDDVYINNVPRIASIEADLSVLRSLGATAEWIGQSTLKLNGAGISDSNIVLESDYSPRTLLLLAGPLVYRFGKARIPLPNSERFGKSPINRFLDTWRSLGYKVETDDRHIEISGQNLVGSNVSFKVNTHMGTDNAIISTLFLNGVTYIKNAAEEVEIDDLISFCNKMGAMVERTEPRTIKVTGVSLFQSCDFDIQPDKTDVVFFTLAALVTKGSLTIQNVNRGHLLSFVNILNKIGCKYEFQKDQLRVWYSGETFEPLDLVTTPAPGILSEWHPMLAVLLSLAIGKSTIHDTVYTNRFSYIKDLNMMGAKIKLLLPSELGLESIISDDSYDIKVSGVPKTVIEINGPVKFKGGKVLITDFVSGAGLLLAALAADGKTELTGARKLLNGFEAIYERLESIGASIELV